MKGRLKKLIAGITTGLMALSFIPAANVGAKKIDDTNLYVASSNTLPDRIMIGYWHNFDNNSKVIKLREVNDNWDIINVSFGETDPTKDKATIVFKPDTKIESEEEFISDVKYLQSKGKKVILSIGGMYGEVLLNSTEDKDKFVKSMSTLIDKYGFDGFDLDLEHYMNAADDFKNPKVAQNINIIKACRELNEKYGDDLYITMAPETAYVQGRMMSGSGGYLPIIYGLRDILDYVAVQLYNSGPMSGSDGSPYQSGTTDFVVAMTEMMLNGFEVGWGSGNMFPGLREDQVIIGLPACPEAAPTGGYVSNTDLNNAILALATGKTYGGRYKMQNPGGYAGLRGVMSWSANWDVAKNLSFSNNARKTLNSLPVVENTLQVGIVTATAPKDRAYTVTATIPSRNTASSYEILENGKVVNSGSLFVGSSVAQTKSVSFTNKVDGNYDYTIVLKDDSSKSVTSSPCKLSIINGNGEIPEVDDKPLGVKEAKPIGLKPLVVGFWQNFGDNGPNVKFQTLKEAHKGWDVYNVSFGEAPGDNCTVGFEPMYDSKQFIQDIKDLHAEGKRVCLSIGGQNGAISLTSEDRKNKFVKSVSEVIDKYGFDGLDIDVETGITMNGKDNLDNPTSPSLVYMIKALDEITDKYGPNFILSMAPQNTDVQGGHGNNYGQNWGCYLPIINNLRDKLTYVTPQYYNNGSDVSLDGTAYTLGTADNLVAESEMLLQGFPVGYGSEAQFFKPLRPDQVLMGLPACAGAAGSGITPPEEVVKALKYLIEGKSFGGKYKMIEAKYPTFRGAMAWSTNWDASVGNKFVTATGNYLHNLVPIDNTLQAAILTNSDVVNKGYTLTATIPSFNSATSYKLYEGDVIVDSGTLKAGDTVKTITKNFTNKAEGTYVYKMVVSDEKGNSLESKLTVEVIKQVVTPGKPDVNGDGKVDILDLTLVSSKYNAVYGDSRYDAKCDMNGDGKIDIFDIVKVARNYDEEKPNPYPNDTWIAGKQYYKGDTVIYHNEKYICEKWDTNSEAPDNQWGPWKKVS